MEAIARIDAALARIEATPVRGASESAGGGGGSDPDLEGRHERLRAATGDAIARLDRLIAAGGDA